jgi:hypothetical protein
MNINVTGGSLEQNEIDAYIEYGKNKYPKKQITVKLYPETHKQLKIRATSEDTTINNMATQIVEKRVRDLDIVKYVENEFEKINDKYEEELMHIYNAIEEKDWEEAKNEYKLLNKNKEIKQCIVEKIVDVCGEPPIYINSPGNETYRVIKKIMGQQFAIQITNAFSEKIKKEFKDFMGDYEG